MWTRLTDQYEQVASENKHFLRQRFYQYEFNKEHDIAAHITMIESMANQLNDIGVSVYEINSQGALVTFNTNLLRKGLTLRLYLGVW